MLYHATEILWLVVRNRNSSQLFTSLTMQMTQANEPTVVL